MPAATPRPAAPTISLARRRYVLSGAGLLAITYLLVRNALAGPMRTSGGLVSRNADGGIVHARAGSGLPAQQAADLHQLLVQSAIALAIMAMVAIGLGWLVADRVLKPLRVMTAAARRMSERSLHERLAMDGPDDELKGLSDTIGELLARLEAAFDSQRRFVANASHELRTPLMLTQTMLQVTLADQNLTLDSLRSACHDVADAHGATLSLRPQPTGGMTVDVAFPHSPGLTRRTEDVKAPRHVVRRHERGIAGDGHGPGCLAGSVDGHGYATASLTFYGAIARKPADLPDPMFPRPSAAGGTGTARSLPRRV